MILSSPSEVEARTRCFHNDAHNILDVSSDEIVIIVLQYEFLVKNLK